MSESGCGLSHVHELSLYCHLLLPQISYPQVPEVSRTPKFTDHSLQPSGVGTSEKGLQILVRLPTAGASCFGNARAGVKLCLEHADTALGAKGYSRRRD